MKVFSKAQMIEQLAQLLYNGICDYTEYVHKYITNTSFLCPLEEVMIQN